MRPANVSAPSTVRRHLLPLLIAAALPLALQACSTNLPKPGPESLPPAPEVRCAPAPMPAPPPVPDCTTVLSWDCVVLMDEWAIEILGLIEKEATKGQASRTCEQGHRDKGAIR